MFRLPTVSVIVLNYNGFDLTINCVASVLKTRYPHFDIVIVDNGSTDQSYEKLKNIYKNNKKIKVISPKKNLFFTGGFNFGAKHAEGEKIILLSNDITVDPFWIKELVLCIKNNPKYLAQPKILSYQNKKIIDNVGGRYTLTGFGLGIGKGEIDQGQYDQNSQLDYVSATTFMIDRKFYLKLKGYDEWFWSHYEDVDLSLRAKKEGGKCLLCYRSKIFHMGSITYKKYVSDPLVLFHIRKNRIRVILKNFNGMEKIFRLFIVMIENIIFIVRDLLTFDREKMFVTINAILKNH